MSTAVLGPLIVGPSISVDDWVPARPPKKPHLRAAYPPPRMSSPDLPPPSPPPVIEDEVFVSDEPLPPPPNEDQLPDWATGQPIPDSRQPKTYSNNEKPAVIPQKHDNLRSHEHKMNLTSKVNLDRPSLSPPTYMDNLRTIDSKSNSKHYAPIHDRSINSSLNIHFSPETHYENPPDLLKPYMNKNHERDIDNSNDMIQDKVPDRYYDKRSDISRSGEGNRSPKNGQEWCRGPHRQKSVESYFKNGTSGIIKESVEINGERKPFDSKQNHDRRSVESLISTRMPDGWKSFDSDQPRSLDSNLSIVEDHQPGMNKPGPQTPVEKKHPLSPTHGSSSMKPPSGAGNKILSDIVNSSNIRLPETKPYRYIREHFTRSASVRRDLNTPQVNGEVLVKPSSQVGSERQSLRFSTTQKLLVNGKIANAVQNGRISPPARKVSSTTQLPKTTPSEIMTPKISFSTGCLRIDVPSSGFYRSELVNVEATSPTNKEENHLKQLPASLPAQCPPTSLQL